MPRQSTWRGLRTSRHTNINDLWKPTIKVAVAAVPKFRLLYTPGGVGFMHARLASRGTTSRRGAATARNAITRSTYASLATSFRRRRLACQASILRQRTNAISGFDFPVGSPVLHEQPDGPPFPPVEAALPPLAELPPNAIAPAAPPPVAPPLPVTVVPGPPVPPAAEAPPPPLTPPAPVARRAGPRVLGARQPRLIGNGQRDAGTAAALGRHAAPVAIFETSPEEASHVPGAQLATDAALTYLNRGRNDRHGIHNQPSVAQRKTGSPVPRFS